MRRVQGRSVRRECPIDGRFSRNMRALTPQTYSRVPSVCSVRGRYGFGRDERGRWNNRPTSVRSRLGVCTLLRLSDPNFNAGGDPGGRDPMCARRCSGTRQRSRQALHGATRSKRRLQNARKCSPTESNWNGVQSLVHVLADLVLLRCKWQRRRVRRAITTPVHARNAMCSTRLDKGSQSSHNTYGACVAASNEGNRYGAGGGVRPTEGAIAKDTPS